jgi:hypothetical protein
MLTVYLNQLNNLYLTSEQLFLLIFFFASRLASSASFLESVKKVNLTQCLKGLGHETEFKFLDKNE